MALAALLSAACGEVASQPRVGQMYAPNGSKRPVSQRRRDPRMKQRSLLSLHVVAHLT